MHTQKWLLVSLIVLLGLLTWVGSLQAQGGYNHFWHSVDGGGAVSSAGGYTLRGVAGQADAGKVSAGGYILTSGVLAFPYENPSLYLPNVQNTNNDARDAAQSPAENPILYIPDIGK